VAAVPEQLETALTFSNSPNSPGIDSMLADILLDDVFEKQDSFNTMSCSAEQSRCCVTPKKGAGGEGCLWIYSRITFQGPSPVRYEAWWYFNAAVSIGYCFVKLGTPHIQDPASWNLTGSQTPG
jgi:hypothetical protein